LNYYGQFGGRGTFSGKDTIKVNGKTLTFAKAVIATGGTAAIPNIAGLKEAPYFTNDKILNLTELPQRLGVIGAGPIGLEPAQAFQRFGSQVTVFFIDYTPLTILTPILHKKHGKRPEGIKNFVS
jgi:pyruvate/2-oxoglutarate dehydrogenase complex dihydrolipoamide dehydrogenase (E3) component